MSVKAPGGFIKILRIYNGKRWQFEHEYNRLDLREITQGVIKKADLTYRVGDTESFKYRSFSITKETAGFRWENRTGSYTLYSTTGLLLESGNRKGTLAKYIYAADSPSKLLSITDRNDKAVFTFKYSKESKNAVSISDTHNRIVQYTWEDAKLQKITDVLGNSTRYHYHPKTHQLVSKADEAGRKFFVTYYPDGAVKSVLSRDDSGFYFSYKRPYDSSYYAKVTSSEGQQKEFWYDSDGHLLKAAVNGRVSRKESRTDSTRLTIDELDNRIKRIYDENENLLSIHHGDGTEIQHEYDKHNNRISTINELGIETRSSYDDRGNLLLVKEAYGTRDQRLIEYEYDADSNLIEAIVYRDDQPIVTTFSYDSNFNLITTTDSLGLLSEFSYDFMGSQLSSRINKGPISKSSYDKAGHLIQSIHPGIPEIVFSYDKAGRRIRMTADKLSMSYKYDFRDNLLSIENPLGFTVRSTFDKDNRLTKSFDAEGKSKSYLYNKEGRVNKVIDGAGNETVINYRTLADCGSCPKTFSNKPARILFPTFERQYEYDQRGRVVKESDIKRGNSSAVIQHTIKVVA